MNAFEKIIKRLEEETDCPNCSMYCADANMCGFDEMRKRAIEIVNQVASEYCGGWIPCSERLPEIEADVLLSLRSLDVYTGFRANTEGSFYVEGEGYVEFENVIAWQPLPQPYKENENE